MIVCIAMMLVKTTAAQNPNTDYKFGVKVYNLTQYEESEKSDPESLGTHNFFLYKSKNLKVLHPTMAFQWKSKKNNFHEVEITDLQLENKGTVDESENDSSKTNVKIYEDKVVQTSIAARYEYILVFNKKKEGLFLLWDLQ